ncbi:ATP-binding cassette domain-containing protein [Cryobacterium sp. BB736]|uniref:ATP-binding cassette domain-containing protein n=1 Tax=Cryobacterium sp. BB736 TaxID=2746963 RepID=UPI0018747764|nr:ATP-binding cassette domain-containing protein [Cryobacterium sp. BB736]
MQTPAIAVSGLRKTFGTHPVLNDVTFEVAPGEIFALLGPNGAGKTTLINILSTLVAPDAGTATVNGFDVGRDPLAVRRSIGLTGQSAAVDEVLTGSENLRMMGRLFGLSRSASAARADELLERFDLVQAARKRAKTYSGGMRRRLDLAISLIVAPSVLFLDEPTTGLDPRSRQELWNVIRSLKEDGRTVFLTTQYLEEADQLADTVAVLNEGHVVASGTPAALKATVGGDVVEVRDRARNLLLQLPTDGSIHGLRAAIAEVDASGVDGDVTVREPSLDDVFLALTDAGAGHAAPELIGRTAR